MPGIEEVIVPAYHPNASSAGLYIKTKLSCEAAACPQDISCALSFLATQAFLNAPNITSITPMASAVRATLTLEVFANMGYIYVGAISSSVSAAFNIVRSAGTGSLVFGGIVRSEASALWPLKEFFIDQLVQAGLVKSLSMKTEAFLTGSLQNNMNAVTHSMVPSDMLSTTGGGYLMPDIDLTASSESGLLSAFAGVKSSAKKNIADLDSVVSTLISSVPTEISLYKSLTTKPTVMGFLGHFEATTSGQFTFSYHRINGISLQLRVVTVKPLTSASDSAIVNFINPAISSLASQVRATGVTGSTPSITSLSDIASSSFFGALTAQLPFSSVVGGSNSRTYLDSQSRAFLSLSTFPSGSIFEEIRADLDYNTGQSMVRGLANNGEWYSLESGSPMSQGFTLGSKQLYLDALTQLTDEVKNLTWYVQPLSPWPVSLKNILPDVNLLSILQIAYHVPFSFQYPGLSQ